MPRPEPVRQHDGAKGAQQDGLLVRSLHLRAVREDAREADFVCSTDALDAYDEIVEQVWDLERYLSNPVVLWAHESHDLPIGQAKNVGVVDGKLQATLVFSKATKKAEQVWQQVLEKTLRAVSVGFRSASMRMEMRNDEEVWILSDNELWEISVCSIPANPEALAKMRARALTLSAIRPSEGVTADHADAVRASEETKNMDEIQKAKAALDEANRLLAVSNATNGEHAKALTAEREKAAGLERELATERAKLSAMEGRAANLEASAKSAAERAEAAEVRLIEADLEALVGKKITPAEKPGIVALAKLAALESREAQAKGEKYDASKSVYAQHLSAVKARPDMHLLGAPILGADATAEMGETLLQLSAGDSGAGFDALVQRSL